jgi:hypothetical protein
MWQVLLNGPAADMARCIWTNEPVPGSEFSGNDLRFEFSSGKQALPPDKRTVSYGWISAQNASLSPRFSGAALPSGKGSPGLTSMRNHAKISPMT